MVGPRFSSRLQRHKIGLKEDRQEDSGKIHPPLEKDLFKSNQRNVCSDWSD